MNRKNAGRILIAVMAFYIFTALLAVGVFDRAGTVYGMSRKGEEEEASKEQKKEDTEEDTKEADLPYMIQVERSDFDREVEEKTATDTFTGWTYDEIGASYPETDWSGLYDTLEETDQMVSDLYGTIDDDSDLPETNDDALEEPVREYYSFVTNNVTSHLNMRSEPGMEAKVIYRLPPRSSGVILELGDEWSKVLADGYTGYCSNEYMTMKEMTKEEYEAALSAGASGDSAASETQSISEETENGSEPAETGTAE